MEGDLPVERGRALTIAERMKSIPTWLLTVLIGLLSTLVHASDNSEVTIAVDTSSDVWVITVKNHGPEKLSFEMLEEFPRSLGIEFWLGGKGHELYAGNNAELLGVFGNPADIRTIEPDQSVVFKLDPTNVSAEDPETLRSWREQIGFPFYDMRIVFRDYASRRIWKYGRESADSQNGE